MARIGIVVAVVIIIVAAMFFAFKRVAKNRENEAAEETANARARAASAASSSATGSGSSSPASALDAGVASTIKRIDPTARQKLLLQLEAARTRRGESIAIAPGSAGAPKELTKDYIRTQVRELIPLLTECYTKALEDDPKLAGKMVVNFTIGGEPEVGGVVETSEVDPESTITHAGMVECVRETMYGAEFVPPAEGGRVTVRYPFEFSN